MGSATIPAAKPFPGEAFQGQFHRPGYNYGPRSLLDRLFHQKRSYARIFAELDNLPKAERTGDRGAANLLRLVNEATSFPITLEDAKRVLAVEPNRYRVAGHLDLDLETVPRVDDFNEFYVYGDDVRRALLARVVAASQNTVWATGTHTGTPVPLIALGPADAAKRFGRLLHTTEWSRLAFELFR